MKRSLKRVWEDIKRGESIDVYVSAVLAIALTILSMVDVVPTVWIAPVTLGVLALLAVAILGNRYRLESIDSKLSQGAGDVLLQKFPGDMQGKLENASEIWLVGVTLSRTIKGQYAALEDKLRHGASVRVLLGDPDGKTYLTYLQVTGHGRRVIGQDEARSEINLSLRRLCALKEAAPDGLEIRVIDHYIAQGMFGFDPDKPNGSLYIEFYPFKMPQESLPKLVLETEDEYWYGFFRDQLHAVWENARPWECRDVGV